MMVQSEWGLSREQEHLMLGQIRWNCDWLGTRPLLSFTGAFL